MHALYHGRRQRKSQSPNNSSWSKVIFDSGLWQINLYDHDELVLAVLTRNDDNMALVALSADMSALRSALGFGHSLSGPLPDLAARRDWKRCNG